MVVTWSWWSLWSHRSVVRCSRCLVIKAVVALIGCRVVACGRGGRLLNIAIIAAVVAAVAGPLASAEVVAAVVSEVAVVAVAGGRPRAPVVPAVVAVVAVVAVAGGRWYFGTRCSSLCHCGPVTSGLRTKVQWRRFFTWTWAFDELDDSWTARLVTGRFVAPKLSDILARCGARRGDAQKMEQDLQERAVKEACV